MFDAKVRFLREKHRFTQIQLAEKASLSLRTIQRVEAGQTIPKGYTLQAISKALGVEKSELTNENKIMFNPNAKEKSQISLINLSVLAFMVFPYGNIILPLVMWSINSKSSIFIDKIAKRIINFQILWSISFSIVLIFIAYIQKSLMITSFPLVFIVLGLAFLTNIFIVVRTTNSFNKDDYDVFRNQIPFI